MIGRSQGAVVSKSVKAFGLSRRNGRGRILRTKCLDCSNKETGSWTYANNVLGAFGRVHMGSES